MDCLRVLVVDDHLFFRFGLCTVLADAPGIEVVGEAATGLDSVEAARALKPHVVVMDLHLPDIGGIEATRRVGTELPEAGVLVLTMFDDSDSVFAAMLAGARGHVQKGAGRDQIVRAVHEVGRGEAIVGPEIAARMLPYLTSPPSGTDPDFLELTDREHEVLVLMAEGRSNAAIARDLSMSPGTVGGHVSSICAKLHAADRTYVDHPHWT